jgi:hypothetical protein
MDSNDAMMLHQFMEEKVDAAVDEEEHSCLLQL